MGFGTREAGRGSELENYCPTNTLAVVHLSVKTLKTEGNVTTFDRIISRGMVYLDETIQLEP